VPQRAVSGPPAPVQCVVLPEAAPRASPERGRCVAAWMEVELALYRQVAVAAGPFSPARAPFPFPAPAARRVLPGASGLRAVLQPGAAALDVTAWPRGAAHAVGLRQAVGAEAAQPVAALAARAAAQVVQAAVVVRRQVAPDASAGLPLVLPWTAASACRPDPAPPWPAPQRAARSARVKWQTQTATPKELSWQAAKVEALS
jgi:hypothetical protein